MFVFTKTKTAKTGKKPLKNDKKTNKKCPKNG
jgi:hypothetical protein